MSRCCIKSCTFSNQIFVKFPISNVPLLNAWLEAIHYDESFIVTEETKLCIGHFKKEDLYVRNGMCHISETAVPSNFRFMNEVPSTSNTYNDIVSVNNTTYASKSIVDNRLVHDSGKEYKVQLLPIFTQNISDNNYNHGESHHIFSTKNNNGAQISLSTLDSVNRSDVQVSNLRSIRKPNSYQETPEESNFWTFFKSEYKSFVQNKFTKKIRLLVTSNKRLISKVKNLESRKQDLLDLQIKHLKLRKQVHETEEALLLDGIDTSKYPIFASSLIDSYPSFNNESGKLIEYEKLSECTLRVVNDK